MPDSAATRTIAWLRPEQAALVRTVADAAGLELVGVGCPEKGRVGAVAGEFGLDSIDDLRATLASAEVDLVWIASPGSFGSSQGDDAAALAAARSRGVKVASLEPIPTAALDLASGGWTSGAGGSRPIDSLRFCPLARYAAAFRDAAGVLENFGSIRTIAIESLCLPHHGSLAARLFGAMELIAALVGEPDTIDAAFVAPAATAGIHALPGGKLTNLHGALTANMRFADGRSACLFASDNGGAWRRTATLLGPAGRLYLAEHGFTWTSPEGEIIDEHRVEESAADPGVVAIADSLRRLMDPTIPAEAPTDHETVLSLGQTALLSCRTGQAESTAMLRRMVEIS